MPETVRVMNACICVSPPGSQTAGSRNAHSANDRHVVRLSDQLKKSRHHPYLSPRSHGHILENKASTCTYRNILQQSKRRYRILTTKTSMSFKCRSDDHKLQRPSHIPTITTISVTERQNAMTTMSSICPITHYSIISRTPLTTCTTAKILL